MKYLLAFALIAVATALPEPMRLLEPVQLPEPVAPFVVPQEVIDAFKAKFADAAKAVVDAAVENAGIAVNFVDEAVNVDAPEAALAPEADAAIAVNFVDEAVNVDAPEAAVAPEADAAIAVNFVDEAVNVDAPQGETIDGSAVNFVEEAINAEAPVEAVRNMDASEYAVNIVDEAVNVDAPEASVADAESLLQVKIIDMPLPESVVMPLMIPTINNVFLDAPVEDNADSAVKFVDFADVDEESASYRPIKLYPNPMWR